MRILSFLFNTSIGRKWVMSLTGLFLILFLVVHLSGNLQLLKSDNGFAFNKYAQFMTTFPVIKFISYGLYFFILLHAVKGLYLAFLNKKARGKAEYGQYDGNANSHWTSRNMAVLGSVILVFLIIHMSQLWGQYKFGADVPCTKYTTNHMTGVTTLTAINETIAKSDIRYVQLGEGIEEFYTRDLYKITVDAFKQPAIVFLYVLSMVAVAFHLWHGFASAFQTIGLNHPTYTPAIQWLGKAFSIVVPALFALIPLYILFAA